MSNDATYPPGVTTGLQDAAAAGNNTNANGSAAGPMNAPPPMMPPCSMQVPTAQMLVARKSRCSLFWQILWHNKQRIPDSYVRNRSSRRLHICLPDTWGGAEGGGDTLFCLGSTNQYRQF